MPISEKGMYKETLIIDNFFSITHLEWEPKEYNIITGEMGSGKSLCLKLLYYIYEIFNIAFFENSPKIISNIDAFYSILERKFKDVFFIELLAEQEYQHYSKIDYSIKSDDKVERFDFSISIKNGNIKFSSKYIDKHFDTWQYKLSSSLTTDTIDDFFNTRIQIINTISVDIGDFFPFAQIYFSDLRTLAAEPNNIITQDPYTNEFLAIKGTLEQRLKKLLYESFVYPNNDDNNDIRNIILESYNLLHIKDIIFENNGIYLIHTDDRKVPLNRCSSGQREIFHLLSCLALIHNNLGFSYGKTNVLFIEEPEVHLFPKEQKFFLELLGRVYNHLNKEQLRWRFFITTHSPYLLNVFNNMLFKGALLKECKDNTKKIEKINKEVAFADFNPDNVSAIFLKHQKDAFAFIGSTIIEEGSNAPFLFSKEIENITCEISNDYNTLEFLKDKI